MQVPQHVHTVTTKYKKLRRKLEEERQSVVEDAELASLLGVREVE